MGNRKVYTILRLNTVGLVVVIIRAPRASAIVDRRYTVFIFHKINTVYRRPMIDRAEHQQQQRVRILTPGAVANDRGHPQAWMRLVDAKVTGPDAKTALTLLRVGDDALWQLPPSSL